MNVKCMCFASLADGTYVVDPLLCDREEARPC